MPWAARTGTTGEVHLVDPYATAIVVVAQQFPGTPFTLDYADADGRPIALCLHALLLRAGWHQLSDVGPAPGFSRRGLILWTPSATLALGRHSPRRSVSCSGSRSSSGTTAVP